VSTARSDSAPDLGACRDWVAHTIVCGLNDVALRTVEQLHLAGARVVVLSDEPDERLARIVRGWGIPHLPRGGHLSEPLFDAGIAGASAVVCAESTDLRTLETVLQIRDLRPDVRVVADLDNPSVAHAVEGVLRSVGVLDVAALFAPAVVETCLGRRARAIELGETEFVAAEVLAPRDGTLRELYGSLAPIGVVTEVGDELVACPGRDQRVAARDRVTLLGTRAELREAGLVREETSAGGVRHVWSTSAIAAPWFVGAALGMQVLFTFYVGNHPFLLARLRVSAGGGLDGQAMRELPAAVRVVAIRRAASARALEHPPRRDTRLAPGDDAYLVGPYAELLALLRHDRETART
jgi:Trk K+ transport system NAD-binding subunit